MAVIPEGYDELHHIKCRCGKCKELQIGATLDRSIGLATVFLVRVSSDKSTPPGAPIRITLPTD